MVFECLVFTVYLIVYGFAFCVFWLKQMSRALRIFIKLGRDANQEKRNQLRRSSLLSWCVAKVADYPQINLDTPFPPPSYVLLVCSGAVIGGVGWKVAYLKLVPGSNHLTT